MPMIAYVGEGGDHWFAYVGKISPFQAVYVFRQFKFFREFLALIKQIESENYCVIIYFEKFQCLLTGGKGVKIGKILPAAFMDGPLFISSKLSINSKAISKYFSLLKHTLK